MKNKHGGYQPIGDFDPTNPPKGRRHSTLVEMVAKAFKDGYDTGLQAGMVRVWCDAPEPCGLEDDGLCHEVVYQDCEHRLDLCRFEKWHGATMLECQDRRCAGTEGPWHLSKCPPRMQAWVMDELSARSADL